MVYTLATFVEKKKIIPFTMFLLKILTSIKKMKKNNFFVVNLDDKVVIFCVFMIHKIYINL